MGARRSREGAHGGARPLVGVIMGSQSDWETMRHAAEILEQFGVPHECLVVSAHLPGMVAAHMVLTVLGVPVESHALKGMDSLLSIVQMPAGVPVGALAIGKAGATNAGLLAVSILGNSRPALRKALEKFRADQTERVMQVKL